MRRIKAFGSLFLNFWFEFVQFTNYSNAFKIDTQEKIQGKISFYYHAIEKGLINNPLRYKFGVEKLQRLLKYLKLWEERGYSSTHSQFRSPFGVIRAYIDLHEKNGISLDDVFSAADFAFISKYESREGGVHHFTSENYFTNAEAPFDSFSNSRHSVRHFTNGIVPRETIRHVVSLARNAPSVCNRQGFRVRQVIGKEKIDAALAIQAGLNATASTVHNLFIITVDRSAFVASSEWYQTFIDGGIFLQNVLYALHFHKLGAVPLNWSKHYFEDKKMQKLLGLNPAEKIICLIAFGYLIPEFKVPYSSRRNVDEILKEI
jgi:nitroreductase